MDGGRKARSKLKPNWALSYYGKKEHEKVESWAITILTKDIEKT